MKLDRFRMDFFLFWISLWGSNKFFIHNECTISRYQLILGIQSPWEVSEIKQDDAAQLADIHVVYAPVFMKTNTGAIPAHSLRGFPAQLHGRVPDQRLRTSTIPLDEALHPTGTSRPVTAESPP